MVARPPLAPLTPLIRTVFTAARLGELTDGELVSRFVTARDDAAFAELVRRLGPTVYGVCRRILGSAEDSEDAFQVAFLVLARTAGRVRPPSRVAAWLHGVATFVARRARTARGRRRTHESAAEPRAEQAGRLEPDVGGVIDEELNRLPERYRLPIVLCEVRGLTVAQAARELGWLVGTVASRLSRGRDALAARLSRRGLTAGVVGGLVLLAAPPARLVAETVSLTAPGGVVPSGATLLLLTEVTRAMIAHKLRLLAAGLFAAVIGMTAGVGVLRPASAAPVPVAATPAEKVLDRVPLADLPALVTSEVVQKDLGLSDEQRKVVEDARAGLKKEVTDAMKNEFAKLLAPGGGPPGGVGLDLGDIHEQAVKGFDQAVTGALKPEQGRRLRQISLQAMGPAALLDRRVVRALELTAEQEDKIESALPPVPKPKMAFGPGGMRPADDPKAVEAVDTAWAAAVKVLTPEQRKRWDALIGQALPTAELFRIRTHPGVVDDLNPLDILPPGALPPGGLPGFPPGGGKPGGN